MSKEDHAEKQVSPLHNTLPLIRLDRDEYSTISAMKTKPDLMAYWTRKGRVRACEAAVLPDLWVTTIGSDGTEIEGLMLSCLWEGPRDQRTSYDLDSVYTVLVPFIGFGRVAGWMTTDTVLSRIDSTGLRID
ncbi:hypothetical protein Gbth_086_002 [Gluconobacter thailandicus F149-1 = NBRC 100600]|jgi:hypothetical protein|uniref:Uncharacterized protein n=6 Tax=Acetobacteraceae TaxID=433 RepID=A0A2S3VXK5_9PROT|nr:MULTISPECIES: hypothetical protein [Acetobacteraceae]GBO81871.1 hypothetical protein AA0242T_2573 [Acetobacter aceti NRIC 0242]KXV29678.1 hypothetical protein AD937_00340 [Gluconobacter japonicus]KXV55107.1 hypothetical protein AD946_00340 [Gluconobacter thailandicus]POF61359.1 hypothetical protein KMAL_30130 [Novacetimonas maltaceti]PYD58014.1 hypothetical protein CFR73_15505 [Novacetimonas maltaceti]